MLSPNKLFDRLQHIFLTSVWVFDGWRCQRPLRSQSECIHTYLLSSSIVELVWEIYMAWSHTGLASYPLVTRGLGGAVVMPLVVRAKDPGYDTTIAQHLQRLISRAFTYGVVGSLVLSWSWATQSGFIFFWCLWIQMCNNLWQRLCAYNLP